MSFVRPTSKSVAGTTTAKFYKLGINTSFFSHTKEIYGSRLGLPFRSQKHLVEYVGVNDGWTNLADNYRLDWQYEEALDMATLP